MSPAGRLQQCVADDWKGDLVFNDFVMSQG